MPRAAAPRRTARLLTMLTHGCIGKRRLTHAEALRSRDRMARREQTQFAAYRCVMCRAWHVGHARRR